MNGNTIFEMYHKYSLGGDLIGFEDFSSPDVYGLLPRLIKRVMMLMHLLPSVMLRVILWMFLTQCDAEGYSVDVSYLV